jgi:tRNA-specific 2-thiouridylase
MTDEKWDIRLWPASFSQWSPKLGPSRQIAVLMSGGVDSSVTAHLLREAGWEVLGITMKIPISCDTGGRRCCGTDAALVCRELDIPHYFVDVTRAFEELIIKRFRQSYIEGHTPNPCAECNRLLKFSLVWDFLEQTLSIRYLATGHYARVVKVGNHVWLGRAKDKNKDQSYFLYGIARHRLPYFVLPLGELTKERVREIAARRYLKVADRSESMELCFAGQGDYRAALSGEEANRAGDITDMKGHKIGTHKGISNYTLGQRRGIGFAGGRPLYVGRIDAETNTIALGGREEISSRIIKANQINVLIPEKLAGGERFSGRIRSYGEPRPCRIVDVSGETITVEFDEPQFAPCPGQKLVLYDNSDNIVAGGTISA